MPSYYPKRGELWLSWYSNGRREQHPIADPVTGGNLKDTRENRRYAKDVVLKKTLELKSSKSKIITLEIAVIKFNGQLNVKVKTLKDYEKRLFLFRDTIGPGKKVNEITRDNIAHFERELRSRRIVKRINKTEKKEVPLSETTISDYWRDIYSFLKYCKECDWIEKIPFERKKKVKKIKTIKRVIPIVLMKKLFDEIRNEEKHYRTYKLLALTGLRPIEAAALTWEQVDFLNDRIIIDNTKVNREDIFPLRGNVYSEAVREFLWGFKQESGKVLGYKNVHAFRFLNDKLKKIIGNQYTLYDIRRTFCTNLLLEGADIYSVQKLMRHKDIQTTLEHYTFIEMIKIGSNLDRIYELYKSF